MMDSLCQSMKSDQQLFCDTITFQPKILIFQPKNFKPLANICSWAGWLQKNLVNNTKGKFSGQSVGLVWFDA